ncbi:MAG TPA: MFS transporter [Steroidobacteraceae bacterium]|jgi:MFS family permease|nr:MFS transporter [Steroidobacteraceae bacterium]
MLTPEQRKEKIKTVFRVASGNFLEMYDFMIFGYFSAAIGHAYFPASSDFASLMFSMTTFAVGFMIRPLGAIFLGAYIDHIGRRKGLLVTLALMSVGTLTIALVPGYETIGLFAPIIVVLGRLCQGFSAGVELGGVSVYLSEIATPGHKGFYVAWQSASQQVAVVFAGVLGFALAHWMPPNDLQMWGWRIPLIVGCLIVPFIYLIRRSLQETEDFAARKHHPRPSEIYASMLRHWRIVITGVAMVLMTTVSFYTITAYTPTFGKEVLKLSQSDALLVTLCVGLSNFLWLPVMGSLSDRLGRRPLLITFAGLALLTAYPAMAWLVDAPSFARLLTVELWLSFIYASYNGAMVVHLTEIVPADVRTAGFSLAYSLATTVGGSTPAIVTYLIHRTDNRAMPGVWLSIAAAVAVITIWLSRARRTAGGPQSLNVASNPETHTDSFPS